MWVVKLGGSLLGSPALKCWLDALNSFSDGQVVIVPGGGLFADAVRESQLMTGLDDATAHKMAVVAMDQYATLMCGLNPSLTLASNELEIAERGWQHKAIVWKPSEMVLADESIAMNWDVTSDSLAAWLAAKLNAQHLVLVKSDLSRYERQTEISVDVLVRDQLVDACFATYLKGQVFNTWIIDKQHDGVLKRDLDFDKGPLAALKVSI